MTHRFAEIAFTESVKATQDKYRTRSQNERLETQGGPNDALGPAEAEFIAARDSFYMATVSETGWPYVQHRGGPAGLLRVLDSRTLGFADFRGNLQYVSVGNAAGNDRVALILVDYPNRRRLKLLGHLRSIDAGAADPELLRRVESADYRARIERVMLIEVEAFDWNCPQHITPRHTDAEVALVTAPLRAEIESLRARLAEATPAGDENAAPIPGHGPLELVITGIRQLTPRVRAYELRMADGSDLPPVAAGAHIDVPVRLADGREDTRRYSISSNPARRDAYEIAVLREDTGSGGSAAVHRNWRLGMRLRCGQPGNDFPLHPDERPAVLIAGGIGITPIKAMAQALKAAGRPVEIHYAGRSAREMAYRDRLQREFGATLRLYPGDAGRRLDPEAVVAAAPADAVFHVCGPARLIDAVRAAVWSAGMDASRVRFERFVAAPPDADAKPVRVSLRRSGMTLNVPADQSILDTVLAAGIDAPHACRAGSCGTCAVKVVAGKPEHRDTVLSEADRRDAGLMCICVSRAQSPELEIDL